MSDPNQIEDDDLTPFGCTTLAQRPAGRVGITSYARKAWDKLDSRSKARLKRTMQEWCEGRMIPHELYKTGGKYGKSPGGQAIGVFKTRQKRLYGFEFHLGELRTFIIIDSDMSKKRDDANKDIIARLKVRVDTFVEEKLK